MIFKKSLCFIFILLASCTLAFAEPKPTSDFYVNDFAGVLTSSQKEFLQSKAVAFKESTGAQAVVVTVDSLDGKSVEQYANELFNSWGIGDSERDDGVLLLVAVSDRKVRIEVGYGLEGELTDGTCGYILDNYVTPSFKQGDYAQGIVQGYDKILETISGDFVPPANSSRSDVDSDVVSSAVFFILFIFFLVSSRMISGMSFGFISSFPNEENSINDSKIAKKSRKLAILGGALSVLALIVFVFLNMAFIGFATSIVVNCILRISENRCPKCKGKMKQRVQTLSRATVTKTGKAVRYYYCTKCQANYKDEYTLPIITYTSSSSSGGGWSSGGGGGGHSGGGGSSGGGGASRGW